MGSRTEGPAARPRRPSDVRVVRRSADSAGDSTGEGISAYRDARQLQLYVHRLRMLERELAAHRAANRSEAARETSEVVEQERALIRRFCADAGLDLPPELPPED